MLNNKQKLYCKRYRDKHKSGSSGPPSDSGATIDLNTLVKNTKLEVAPQATFRPPTLNDVKNLFSNFKSQPPDAWLDKLLQNLTEEGYKIETNN